MVTCFPASVGQDDAGRGDGVVDAVFDRVAAEMSASAGGEERGIGGAPVFGDPSIHHGDGGWQQRCAAFFAALAETVDVRADTGVDVGDGEPDDLADAQPGLDRQGEHRMVAAAGAGVLVAGAQQCIGFAGVKPGEGVAVHSRCRDRQDALDHFGMLVVAQRGVTEQGVNRGQAGVAGAHAVAANFLQIVEEPGDGVGIKIADFHQ